jgi:hypothetical protein
MIVGAPGVAVAGPDHEAHAAIEVGCNVEVAHGMNDVVKAAGHCIPSGVSVMRLNA